MLQGGRSVGRIWEKTLFSGGKKSHIVSYLRSNAREGFPSEYVSKLRDTFCYCLTEAFFLYVNPSCLGVCV